MAISKKEIIILLSIFVLFIALHLLGLHLPYHQDEYKWPMIVNPAITEPGGIPHPPVGEFIYRELGKVVGYDNFRIIPFIFSVLNFFLLFYLVKIIFDSKTALWSVFLFTISFYSLLASLMVDTDGAIMPFFFLLSVISYFKFREGKNRWLISLLIFTALGFLVKTSFFIFIAALMLDFFIEKEFFNDKKRLIKASLYSLGLLSALVLLLFLVKFMFPSFNLDSSLKYWEHFVKFENRGWFQTFVQFSKSILYLSPLLIAPVFFMDREMLKKTRIFFLFILIGLFFYLIAFDFSTGALDRYMQFTILPFCIISGAVLAKMFSGHEKVLKNDVITVFVLSFAVFGIQFVDHLMLPLYPKTEWIQSVIHLKWQFLFPFTGGSGPTGFYVSFLFIALIWFCSVIFALSSLKMENVKKRAVFCIFVLGILYNTVFIEEYLFGKINGSPYRLFENAEIFIRDSAAIKKVMVYNDIGGYEIQKLGKYQRRLYAAPQFEQTYREFFDNFSGHILYVDIPWIGNNNFYSGYLDSCKNIYEKSDKYITAKILECYPYTIR